MKQRVRAILNFSSSRPDPMAPVLGRIGCLETRFARSDQEVLAAQSLRFDVFYRELGAKADARTRLRKRDKDRYDRHCQHLLVLDTSKNGQIIGTYRVMSEASARAAGGFYSQSEFNLDGLLEVNHGKKFIELGRSCIAQPYRNRRTMELMWQGLWAHVLEQKIDFLIGCASFSGTDPHAHRDAFRWLDAHALLDQEAECQPRTVDFVALSDGRNGAFDQPRAFAALPPLLKGYLRVGARVSSHAVIDRQFDTIDVLVVLNVADIAERYIAHYGTNASRFAA